MAVYGGKDLTGKRFGKLLVLSRHFPDKPTSNGGKMWKCRCDCGKITYVRTDGLTTGAITSCGCIRIIDLTGKRFGSLTVLNMMPRTHSNRVMWRCKCDCGNICYVRSDLLLGGSTHSCGCINSPNLVGKRFGRLTVISEFGSPTCGKRRWLCQCDCGNQIVTTTANLNYGSVKSCGCLVTKNYSPGDPNADFINNLRRRWSNMMRRCYNPRDAHYKDYGGRGIYVCDEWKNDRRKYIDWAMSQPYKDITKEIDRINNDGPYAPWNCRWATRQQQVNNTRRNHTLTVGGVSKTIAQWNRALGFPSDWVGDIIYTKGENVAKQFILNYLKKGDNLMFNLIDDASATSKTPTVNFNTDSMFDLMTGSFVRGVSKNGEPKWFINGGLGPSVAGVQGRPGNFKSTLAASLAMRLSAIYDSQMVIFDSEDAISRSIDRILMMAGDHSSALNPDYVVTLDAKNQYDLESIREQIRELGEKKKSNSKDLMITSPFIDPKTGDHIRVMRPSVIFIDSYSECFSREEESLMTEKGLDDGRAKTLFMLDANKKTLVLRNLNRYAAEYGIEIIVSAHYGQKLNLDPYSPQPKLLQWGSQNETPKGVGSKFAFLTSPLMLINSCTKLQDDAKQCKYKLDQLTSAADLSELIVLMQRCKNNASGLSHPFVVSQDFGLLTEVSDYHFLRCHKGYAMTGNNITHQSMFLPKVNLTRNSFREACLKNRQLIRALQLSAQLLYIQNNWSSKGWDFDPNIDPRKLVDWLMSDKNKYTVDRVLNSIGYWTPFEDINDESPEYLSIFDILEAHGKCIAKS